jgi:hypothetical protein
VSALAIWKEKKDSIGFTTRKKDQLTKTELWYNKKKSNWVPGGGEKTHRLT